MWRGYFVHTYSCGTGNGCLDIHRERYQAEVGASPRVTLAAERGRKIYVTLHYVNGTVGGSPLT